MSPSPIALVVDDEAALRRLTSVALEQRGFSCDQAADGEEALQLARNRSYDAIVTDLRMPRRHGHSFATEILNQSSAKPILVVLTGVAEPRIALDLLARGVDDIILKPVDFRVLAAKVHALWSKRQAAASELATSQLVASSPKNDSSITRDIFDPAIPNDEESGRAIEFANSLRHELRDASSTLAAFVGMPEIGREVRRTARWLQLAMTGENPVDDIDALRCLSCGFLADITIAVMLRRLLRRSPIGGIDAEAICARATFGTIAMAHSLPQVSFDKKSELLLATFLAPLLRPLIASLRQSEYSALLRECVATGSSLSSLEKQRGVQAPFKLVEPSLSRWGISKRVLELLEFSSLPYRELGALRQSLRSDVKRVKIGCLLGQAGHGQLDDWEEIDIPPASTAARLGFKDPAELIRSIHERYSDRIRDLEEEDIADKQAVPKQRNQCCIYFSSHPGSLLGFIIQAMGYTIVDARSKVGGSQLPYLVNAVDVPAEQVLQRLMRGQNGPRPVLVCDKRPEPKLHDICSVIELPCSASAFTQRLNGAALEPRTEEG